MVRKNDIRFSYFLKIYPVFFLPLQFFPLIWTARFIITSPFYQFLNPKFFFFRRENFFFIIYLFLRPFCVFLPHLPHPEHYTKSGSFFLPSLSLPPLLELKILKCNIVLWIDFGGIKWKISGSKEVLVSEVQYNDILKRRYLTFEMKM